MAKLYFRYGAMGCGKTRDIIIANKLKTEYSPQDVNRILNGFRPWNEEEK